jgi:hypothetical protein
VFFSVGDLEQFKREVDPNYVCSLSCKASGKDPLPTGKVTDRASPGIADEFEQLW